MRALIAAAALATALPLYAAEPSSGTLSEDGEAIEFGGGPFAGANVSGTSAGGMEPTCINPVLACDDFALTVDLPEDYSERYPSGLVRIVIQLDDPGANAAEDYDLFLYDASGTTRLGSSTSEGSTEVVSFLADGGLSEFLVRIVPFSATASSYKGLIELIPGEPAFAPEEEEGGSDGFAGAVKNGTVGSPGRQGGGGAAGGLLLALGLLGRRRG